jgi:DNA-binding transcriptional MerR regulator
MLLITDNSLVEYLKANERFSLGDFLNKKRFKVSDTLLTYRQVNSLDTDKLLATDRKVKKGWRKFSFKELVYVLIVKELKKFGLKHEQLKKLWEAFFKQPAKNRIKGIEINRFIGELCIGCTFGQVEIKVAINSEGEIVFYDPPHSIVLDITSTSKPLIVIRLNDIVNELLKKMGKEPIPISQSLSQNILDNVKNVKEEELLKIINNKTFSVIKIKKKNGEIDTVYAERINEPNAKITAQDLIKIINSKDFQTVTATKTNGIIVKYKTEETYKL